MACISGPSCLNGKGNSAKYNWPHSVAWISQWLAEPRTRVRIAVGPLTLPLVLDYFQNWSQHQALLFDLRLALRMH